MITCYSPLLNQTDVNYLHFRLKSCAAQTMENQEENSEPPGRQTRRATKAIEEAKKVEEERIFNEFPHIMMVGYNEEVRQRAADKVHDEGRLQLDAIERGEGGGGDVAIKQEEEEEEEPEERRQEPDALLQQGDELGDGDLSIKEEISEGEEEEMLEANPVGSILTEGQTVAIPTDLFLELELKEEEQDEGGHLATSGGAGVGDGTEQESILLHDEEDEAVAENEEAVEEETVQVIRGK